MIPLLQAYQTVILADGRFPEHATPLSFLRNARRIVCCDGAAEKLVAFGREPDAIVGDFDSISEGLKQRFPAILFPDPEQETNDLTKAVGFCTQRGWKEIAILGATGNREDHTLGNLSLLNDYEKTARVQMLTDCGVFVPQCRSAVYESYPGQQVSIFSLTPTTRFRTQNLVYPLRNRPLTSWWQGTLNESEAEWFEIAIDRGEILVFRGY
jgi:thiamine pyrophosphokinase